MARAANAYGAQNKDNGVSVGFADLSNPVRVGIPFQQSESLRTEA